MRKNISGPIWAIGVALALASVSTAHAEEKRTLTTAEIKALFVGNTLSGVFGEKKTRYAQRVHANGTAVIHVDGSPVRFAPWFVTEPDSYCEDWDKDGVYCYKITLNSDTGKHHFVYSDGSLSPQINLQKGFHSITFD